jgi:superfamily II DNA/RNA helicase
MVELCSTKRYFFQDVDAIHEYLLLKGILAVSTHGGKDQEERSKAVTEFRFRTE